MRVTKMMMVYRPSNARTRNVHRVVHMRHPMYVIHATHYRSPIFANINSM